MRCGEGRPVESGESRPARRRGPSRGRRTARPREWAVAVRRWPRRARDRLRAHARRARPRHPRCRPAAPIADTAGEPDETIAVPRPDGGERVKHHGHLVHRPFGPPPLGAVERNDVVGGNGTGRVRQHLDLWYVVHLGQRTSRQERGCGVRDPPRSTRHRQRQPVPLFVAVGRVVVSHSQIMPQSPPGRSARCRAATLSPGPRHSTKRSLRVTRVGQARPEPAQRATESPAEGA